VALVAGFIAFDVCKHRIVGIAVILIPTLGQRAVFGGGGGIVVNVQETQLVADSVASTPASVIAASTLVLDWRP
jgi:hypothetical protein